MMKFYGTLILASALFLVISAPISGAEIGYTVRDGETLSEIASKFKISADEIIKANKIEDPSTITPGTRLIIPIIEDDEIVPEETTKNYIVHYVKSGDSLYKIAQKYHTTVEVIAKFNNIAQDKTLHINEEIKIPVKQKPSRKQIKEPLTIFDLASLDEESNEEETDPELTVNVKADNVKGKNLLDLSELDNAEIEIKNTTDKPEKVSRKPKRPEFIFHKVEKGDTISRISKTYGVSQNTIMKENGISGRTILRIGQQLRIPNPAVSKDPNIDKDDGLVSRNLTKRDQLVRYALQKVGGRYKYAGTNIDYGVDCSGFTMQVYDRFGVNLPHSSADQSKVGRAVEKNNLVPGDLVFFRTSGRSIGHVGIYIGDGKFVHATRTNGGIAVTSLSDEYYVKRYVCARRIL